MDNNNSNNNGNGEEYRHKKELATKIAGLAQFPKGPRGNPTLRKAGWPDKIVCPKCLEWVDRDMLVVYSRLGNKVGLGEAQNIVVGHAKPSCLYVFSPTDQYFEELNRMLKEEGMAVANGQ